MRVHGMATFIGGGWVGLVKGCELEFSQFGGPSARRGKSFESVGVRWRKLAGRPLTSVGARWRALVGRPLASVGGASFDVR